MSKTLFTPLKIGSATLDHRLVMAPLTRFRADDNHVPTTLMKTYYDQRASVPGTLLISEATAISPAGTGYKNIPGIFSADHVAGWKPVIEAVHAKKSHIYCQLWHLGRASDAAYLKSKGLPLLSSSAVRMQEGAEVPEAMTEEQIQQTIADYAHAAKCAIEAGFDGVEIHGANGYLIDQFTQDVSNKRTDKWGGSVENRTRFGFEVAKAVTAAVGSERVGIRLSPFGEFQAMGMANPIEDGFLHLVKELKALKLAYVHLVDTRVTYDVEIDFPKKVTPLIEAWGTQSPILIAGGFKADTAKKVVDQFPGQEIAVVFGRYFISNPDLPWKISQDLELTPYNRDTFYAPGVEDGYTNYPFAESFKGQAVGVAAA